MKKFTCPIDERIVINIEEDFLMHQIVDGMIMPIANCQTLLPNSACKMIEKGCFGCRYDKEAIFKLNQQLGQKTTTC